MKETSFQNAGTYQRSKQGFGVTVSDSMDGAIKMYILEKNKSQATYYQASSHLAITLQHLISLHFAYLLPTLS